jgi:hypothetical protein
MAGIDAKLSFQKRWSNRIDTAASTPAMSIQAPSPLPSLRAHAASGAIATCIPTDDGP